MRAAGESLIVHGVEVHGLELDSATRCAHYHGPTDIIALRFACCGQYFPCFECHQAVADHPPQRWAAGAREEEAVLCGACGARLTVRAYLASHDCCPTCGTGFNPGCARHHHLYFEP